MGRFEELLLIFAIGLLLFGPNKLTDLAKALGSSLNEFKKAANPDAATVQTVQVQAPAAKAPVRRARKTAAAKKTSKVVG